MDRHLEDSTPRQEVKTNKHSMVYFLQEWLLFHSESTN